MIQVAATSPLPGRAEQLLGEKFDLRIHSGPLLATEAELEEVESFGRIHRCRQSISPDVEDIGAGHDAHDGAPVVDCVCRAGTGCWPESIGTR